MSKYIKKCFIDSKPWPIFFIFAYSTMPKAPVCFMFASKKKFILFLTCSIVLANVVVFYLISVFNLTTPEFIQDYNSEIMVSLVEYNYGSQVDQICKKKSLPAAYFKALIVLECSGNKNPPSRFEAKVYNKLLNLQKTGTGNYENIRAAQLKNLSQEQIKDLARSWGPFQIMGYHCLETNYSINMLKSSENLEWEIEWCRKTYGTYLKRKKFKDAFHMHNTGAPLNVLGIPFTHNPRYIYRGLRYMKEFEKN